MTPPRPIPAWLQAFHAQWNAARGGRLEEAKRAYTRDWSTLLENAGIIRAEDQQSAAREAAQWEAHGLELKRHRYRKFIERVSLPPEREAWFRELFAGESSAELRNRALQMVRSEFASPHAKIPEQWASFCNRLQTAFEAGRSVGIFRWRQPDMVRELLEILRGLTSTDWTEGTLIRHASTQLKLESKRLERHRRTLENGLGEIFQSPVTLEDLGLSSLNSHVLLAGHCVLHFEDREMQEWRSLHSGYSIDALDLEKALRIETTAQRILTVENAKTTFRQLALANQDQSSLIVATSFPSAATTLLLQKLPAALPHFHFGDTDGAGFGILQKLRHSSNRPVKPFLMHWRDSEKHLPLTQFDRRWLDRLQADVAMNDCSNEFEKMLASGRKGDFEQESFGAPDLNGWPFYLRSELRSGFANES